jgi:copper chaperone NosL
MNAGAGERAVSRRSVLAAAGAGLGVALAGCGDDGAAGPEPITLTEDDRCEMCGMVIPNHPGPNAQIFYADNRPAGHENPARFCSTWEAFQFDFRRQDEGWTREAFFVTDYSSVDYEITTNAGQQFISSHPAAEAFVDATGVTFDVGSDVLGAMGRDLIGFSETADAESFAQEYGGRVVAFADVTRSMIAQLGAN